MKKIREKLLVGIAGVLLGIISYYVINGWYNIIPWAVIALAIGYAAGFGHYGGYLGALDFNTVTRGR